MTELVFFLEEPSAKEMLQGVLPKLLPETVQVRYVVFRGKQDLEKRLRMKLKGWLQPDAQFVVMRDQDSGDCRVIKQALRQKCTAAGHSETLVRIACRELESFYLGDLNAVAQAIGSANLPRLQNKAKFRNPDALGNPAEELKKLVPTYQKMAGSRAIGSLLNLEQNRSNSFMALINGVKRLIC